MSEDWTEKYRPQSLSEVVGNQKALESIRLWAQRWVEGEPETRALILAGEPGVGKTTAAHALARDFNWGVLELNASDARNKDTIEAVALSGSVNETFTDSGEFRPTRDGGRKLIILDEADNLYERLGAGESGPAFRERLVKKKVEGAKAGAGSKQGETGEAEGDSYTWDIEKVKVADVSDRGGKAAIINTIRQTRQPIILIVNDLYSLTRGTGAALKSLCQTIRFSKLQHRSIKKALGNISRAEGVEVHDDVLDIIAQNAGGDLRSGINDLQALSFDKTVLGPKDVMPLASRDLKPGTFDAVAGVFAASSFSRARDAAQNIDESPENFILWMDENLHRGFSDPVDFERAYRRLSRADIYLRRSRKTQVYRFWAYARDMMTAGVALSRSSPASHQYGRLNFPQFLLKMSRSKGQRSLRDAASLALARHTHCSVLDTRVNYLHLYKHLMQTDDELAVSLAKKTRMEPPVLGYLLDQKSTSARVKKILQAVEEGMPAPAAPSIFPDDEDEPAPEVEEEDADDGKASDGKQAKGEKEGGGKGKEEKPENEGKGSQKSLFDY